MRILKNKLLMLGLMALMLVFSASCGSDSAAPASDSSSSSFLNADIPQVP
ncbi:MAG: hypothetical protein AABY86_01555 [Bdellovibrionota bacterium]